MSQSERRLAAIMFTDIVGYTALGQENEPLALEVLERQRQLLRPLFSKHGGREIKTMGDAFLAEFGSALEAVLCAVDIQGTVHSRNLERGESLRIKVGIHLGDVIHQAGDVLGDAVNVASRIEPLAEGGGICISEQALDQVRNKVSYPFIRLESRQLKNVKDSIEVYRIVMPWDAGNVVQSTQLDRKRIAVLPLTNISPDPKDEYFADGMTEELISTLSKVPELSVISRTSVVRYRGSQKALSEISQELKVGTVLEGSVRRAGDRIRITAQLIDAPSDKHLWSETYDREMDDIFSIQTDIAGKIAQALRVRLVTTKESGRQQTRNIDAYTLYLRGRFLWNKRNKEGVLEALKLFEEAIRIDPNYARAYSGLADAYYVAATGGFMNRIEGLSKSYEMIAKALELDDTLAEAHASLGINLLEDLRYDEARREFERAIELNPNYATAHHWYSLCLIDFGSLEGAIGEIEKAHELDPLSPVITAAVASLYSSNGRLDEALAEVTRLIDSEPSYAGAYDARSDIFLRRGERDKAIADWETHTVLHKFDQDEIVHRLGFAEIYAWFGESEKALQIVQEVLQRGEEDPLVRPLAVATCYAILGETDEFFTWIDRAIRTKRFRAWGIRYHPYYDKVRHDPRFPEIFKKLGLPY